MVPQPEYILRICRARLAQSNSRGREPGHVLRASAQAIVLSAAYLRLDVEVRSDEERATSRRTAELVERDRGRAHIRREAHRNLGKALGQIRVERYAPCAGDLGQLHDVVTHTGLVVYVHKRHERGVGPQRALEYKDRKSVV